VKGAFGRSTYPTLTLQNAALVERASAAAQSMAAQSSAAGEEVPVFKSGAYESSHAESVPWITAGQCIQ